MFRFDHIQLAIPRGGEEVARAFWCGLLAFVEVPKPPALATRGGAWFEHGHAVVHVGAEEPFVPAQKAHPAFRVDNLDQLISILTNAGHAIRWDDEIVGVRRCHVNDPFGNRIELIQA
jgi:catechol 2,3-dioxygenase-like lactoylglutathione lyase family enzyme